MALMLLRMLVLARLLDLQEFAAFSGGILASGTFCMLGCLGLQSMLQREWPVQLARGVERRGPVRAAQCHWIALGCAALGLAAAAAGFAPSGLTPAMFAVGILHGLSQQIFLVATVESRSRGDMLRFASQNLWRSALVMGASVAVAVWTGSAPAALAIDAVLSLAIALACFNRSLARARVDARCAFALGWRRLAKVRWGSALQLCSVAVMGFAVLNADRWAAAGTLGASDFARYAFAWTILSVAQSAQAVVNASVYPMLARRYGEAGQRRAFDLAARVSLGVLLLGALLALPAGFGAAWAIHRWYPPYMDAIALLPLFIGVAVLRLSDFWSSFLLIAGLEGRLLGLNLLSAALGVALWGLAMRMGFASSSPLLQVGALAGTLTLGSYTAVAVAAWGARRP